MAELTYQEKQLRVEAGRRSSMTPTAVYDWVGEHGFSVTPPRMSDERWRAMLASMPNWVKLQAMEGYAFEAD